MNITPKEELTLYALVLIILTTGFLLGFTSGLGVQPA